MNAEDLKGLGIAEEKIEGVINLYSQSSKTLESTLSEKFGKASSENADKIIAGARENLFKGIGVDAETFKRNEGERESDWLARAVNNKIEAFTNENKSLKDKLKSAPEADDIRKAVEEELRASFSDQLESETESLREDLETANKNLSSYKETSVVSSNMPLFDKDKTNFEGFGLIKDTAVKQILEMYSGKISQENGVDVVQDGFKKVPLSDVLKAHPLLSGWVSEDHNQGGGGSGGGGSEGFKDSHGIDPNQPTDKISEQVSKILDAKSYTNQNDKAKEFSKMMREVLAKKTV
jgi:hypothetical protein